MRLDILTRGHRPLTRALMWLMRRVMGHVPGPMAVFSYRPELFGKPFVTWLHEAMRGATEWSDGEVELFAAFVSKKSGCVY